MNQPYISIGIPIYNADKYLDYAITSILVQTYQNWELILIDDGSTDNSLNIAKKYSAIDNRIRVISDGQNKKLAARLNQLTDESKYDYVARMDADDLINPKRLEIQLNFLLKNPDFDLVSTGLVSIDSNNQAYSYRKVDSLYTSFDKPLKRYPITHAAILAKKEWFLRNRYNETCIRSQDYELWSRAISKKDFKMAIIPELLYYYRESGNINAHSMINAYNENLKIHTRHYGKINILNLAKNTLKKLIVISLDKTGNIDILSRLRNYNNKKIDQSVLKKHQDIINKILAYTD